MKVFISWSGVRSSQVALALKRFLQTTLQATAPWVSDVDIDPGSRWSKDVADALEETNFGVLCLTPDNVGAEWLHFEAGAIAKSVEDGRVVPYLAGLGKAQVPNGPLSQFQMLEANEADTLRLLNTVNQYLPLGNRVDEEVLQNQFKAFWPDLERAIAEAPPAKKFSIERSDSDKLDEILGILRSMRTRPSEGGRGRHARAISLEELGLLQGDVDTLLLQLHEEYERLKLQADPSSAKGLLGRDTYDIEEGHGGR